MSRQPSPWLPIRAILSRALPTAPARLRQTPGRHGKEPLRDALFSVEQLEQHARTLAHEYPVVGRRGSERDLLRRLARNERTLEQAYRALAADVRRETLISPAAEWLLDNYSIVTDQIREIRVDLPQGYYQELPKLTRGSNKGAPRVYLLALELIAHTDGRIDVENLLRFVLAYQSEAPLTMGELWAMAIMLRVGLVENLGRLAALILETRELRLDADRWTAQLLTSSDEQAEQLSRRLAELERAYPKLPPPFAVQLLRGLRDQEGEADRGTAGAWLDRAIAREYGSAEAVVRAEHLRQTANQASVGNTITSMRAVSAIDWADWFERVSQVEQVLRRDPAGVYARSTFATRDRYRHEVERLAKHTDLSESSVAWRLVEEAGRSGIEPGDSRAHIGYYLIGLGARRFESGLGYRTPLPLAAQRALLDHATPVYLLAVSGGTAALSWAGVSLAHGRPRKPADLLSIGLILLPASDLAQGLVNWAVAQILPPRRLPRLDLSDGVPPELRTIVVIPTLLLTPESIQGQFDRLEILYLANHDPNLHFALLTDFADAPQATMPEDQKLLDMAVGHVQDLNAQYGGERFFLFHRGRRWNPGQSSFMGWERKRGKLEEFNRLLEGATDTTFEVQAGDLDVLREVRYVITLDADTQLPRDAAHKLIGTIAHPLNQAVIDPKTRIVVEGYGILQPRIGVDLPSATRTRFARLFSGNIGIDPYTTAVSDTYMDLLGEGIFAGKGIYDPVVLREVLADRFPDNALLSHDLIEGNYARAGLVTDIELLDSYPSTYAAYTARMHRWVRGDWQIARWLFPWVPCASGGHAQNSLPPIARYKIFDNLRRSLVAPATVGLLATGWLRDKPATWTAVALLPLAQPALLALLNTVIDLRRPSAWAGTLRAGVSDLALHSTRFALNLVFLLDHAAIDLDAIARTLVRLTISGRNLLEWETAEQSEARLSTSNRHLLRRTAFATPLGLILARAGWSQMKAAGPVAMPIAGSWLAAPAIAGWLDSARQVDTYTPSDAEQALLRRLARAYWDYFGTFATEDSHWLAPDNFQETPAPIAAHRASPTNIGLQLAADLAAYDFGYIGLIDLAERTERVFATLDKLAHYHGHLLNWYDTTTLEPLPPAYVSMVDSGNLAGYLLALRQGYLELRRRPVVGPEAITGLEDLIRLAASEGEAHNLDTREVEALLDILSPMPQTIAEYRAALRRLAQEAGSLGMKGGAHWINRIQPQARSILRDLDTLLPSPEQWDEELPPAVLELYGAPPQLDNLPSALERALTGLAAGGPSSAHQELQRARAAVLQLIECQAAIARAARDRVESMNFQMLFDDQRQLFSIGFNIAEGYRDHSYYDLLASEARLGSFVAIAKGDVPQEHWFHLGRSLAPAGSQAVLVSWTGTMFEYLMPLLVMRRYRETLLDETYEAAVEGQISYGRRHHVPWGVSESSYNARDMNMNYQYRAFGIPGMGLKRGLGSDLVVAPYATLLALPVRPKAAIDNIQQLRRDAVDGTYGLYEAIDFTRDRVPPGSDWAIVRSFMVHHQGMSLLALDNYLHSDVMQRRFHAEPMVRATELLLQERAPLREPRRALPETPAEGRVALEPSGPAAREFSTPATPAPASHLLSNGTYSVMITNSGASGSRCAGLAVTRWQADSTRDCWGSFFYIRDVRSGATWSAAFQPTRHTLHDYRVVYAPDKAEFRQRVAGIDTRMEVTISPEDNAEVRRISLTNATFEPRELEVTSYAEVVLAPPAADSAHPAFSKLFIQTEYLSEDDALLASRRPRSPSDKVVWAIHVAAVRGHASGATEYETDRSRFIGRGRTPADPAALAVPLSSTTGAVLDPIFSLRRRVRIVPGGTVQVTFTTAVGESREEALQLAAKYHDYGAVLRAFEMAWTQSRVELRHLEISTADVHRFQRLAAAVIYSDGRMRAKQSVLAANTRGQPGLWAYGISGDLPIVLVRIADGEDLALVRDILKAHEYWQLKNLSVDIVLLNEHATSYIEGVQEHILSIVRSTRASSWLDRPGGIRILRADQMPDADHILLRTAAHVCLSAQAGDLLEQLRERKPQMKQLPQLRTRRTTPVATTEELPRVELELANPFGGFSPAGDEYVIDITPEKETPAPWINVLANPRFGCLVSEHGAGYTWSENSRENRLTPWFNDPVTDQGGEAIYLRDEASGDFWSPVRQPSGTGSFRVRHGFGYSAFEHQHTGIFSRLTILVPLDDSVKVMRLEIENRSGQPRRLSATFYAEWTLGVEREQMAPFVITSFDAETGALLARNPYNTEFGERVAFAAADRSEVGWTCARTDFLGRNGDLQDPLALSTPELTSHCGAGLDPCAALRRAVEVAPGERTTVVFVLGQGVDQAEAQKLIGQYRTAEAASEALDKTVAWWRRVLGRVEIHTPDAAFDVLLNGWLLYQTLSCRIWGRSAFYQSGGAYGFRDQLQDTMALVFAAPDLLREHILRSAQRQFVEGDVQHWWHPPTGRGIRTHFSDDYLWLPFVTSYYVDATGDRTILDEVLPFLEGRPLKPDEAEYYDLPAVSQQKATLYDHCLRAIEHGLRFGEHGLPLMGTGDWNDGMNLVGAAGKGESVWVGWFLHMNLERMAGVAEMRGDDAHAAEYRAQAHRLQQAIEEHAWDGEWYLRAYFDDGTPLGSAQNEECRIDSLSQSWAVISGAARQDRAVCGMQAVERFLVDRRAGLIKLFTPAFDHTAREPGYIKGYVPGVRENGGQYTHAAIWVIWAYAMLGDGRRAGELFSLINPVRHTLDDVERYKVEPYVVAADVYAVPPHTGRGGWTWYTGSAGWMYRTGVEMLAGLRREGEWLVIQPCIPPEWPRFEISYRFGETCYRIGVENPDEVATGVRELELDGDPVARDRILLQDDGKTHEIRVVLGAPPS